MSKQIRILGLVYLLSSILLAYFAWYNWQQGLPQSRKTALVCVAVLVLEIPCFALLVFIDKRGRERRSYFLTNGHLLEAKVVEIRKSEDFCSNFPLTIIASGKNPLTGQEQVFESGPIWIEPEKYVKAGDTIKVYNDPRNPDKYLVDTSFIPERKIFSFF
jgi:hypothetical protein